MMTTQFKTPTADLQHQYDLLQKEFEYEKEMYREQTERAGIHRRIQQGLCWYPVVPGKSYYNSLNQLVVEIGQLEDKETEHNFEYGRPVCFFTTKGGGKPEYLNFSAVISYVQDDRMVVILPLLTHLRKYKRLVKSASNFISTRPATRRCSTPCPPLSKRKETG
ncbi:MAG: hypothetical protein ACLR6J_14310 [Parabacteroides merdae]